MINTTPEHKVAGILDKIKIIFAEAKKILILCLMHILAHIKITEWRILP